ncbi:DUF2326 domain-containing protein [Lachnospiraceae bacterium MD1]|uniref:DUF2326 domain-containing protein n=1 Tax=Variimorphobacter saccharofermentans TaxID=2755051 RepID=A0A839K3L3_9FIRM|nr:DUF2326 domain-containing protein [Variimorphobacter saccharofermentans]MBB2184493.1 DUF2326 domain-containing protein [Variimorphobacter saccharofermentans]
MQLISLVVSKSTTNEIIRKITFNPKGLSLIVDETNKVSSGSNIGKTTAVKIIDLCLGAKSVSSLYKEKDTGENVIVGEFLEKNKVVAELTCRIDGKTHVFKRALYKNGKSLIDGEPIRSATEYRSDLNKIIFNNLNDKPSFRQLVSKFIRLENANEAALLKFLGTYTNNYEYQAIYEYLFGIDESKSENIDIISLNESIDKDIEAIYRKNGVASVREFETKIGLMKEEVEKFRKSYSEVTVIEDYETKIRENQSVLSDLKKLEAEYSKINLKQELMKEKIRKEEEKIFAVDTKILRQIYEKTELVLDKQLCDFEELEKFHNGMINKRIAMLQTTLNELETESKIIYDELQKLQKVYEKNYVSFNVELKDKFEEKYNDYAINKIKLENFINDYNYIIEKFQEKENNLSKKVEKNNDKTKKGKIEERLSHYFKELTSKIIGEPFAIVLNEDSDEDAFPVKIIGMNGKPGTGIKKAMITCFDLAHINLIIEMKYHMPVFAIHDKMENIDLKELAGIISEARNFEGQYIFPILSDRIDLMGIKEEEVVLRLSANDKFFRI